MSTFIDPNHSPERLARCVNLHVPLYLFILLMFKCLQNTNWVEYTLFYLNAVRFSVALMLQNNFVLSVDNLQADCDEAWNGCNRLLMGST
jgi:hypothetical protein